MNKRIKIFIITTIIALTALVGYSIYYNYELNKKTIQDLNKKSTDFIGKWGNYTNSSTEAYLGGVSVYLSDDEKRALEEEAKTVKEYIASGYEPNSSAASVKYCKTQRLDKGYESTCGVSIEIVGYSKKDATMRIVWGKYGKDYLISNWYTE